MGINTLSHRFTILVSSIIARTAEELRDAVGDPIKQRHVLCRYYKLGMERGLSMGELVDFLGVSIDNVLDAAGYGDEEAMAVMAISDSLTDEEIRA